MHESIVMLSGQCCEDMIPGACDDDAMDHDEQHLRYQVGCYPVKWD